MRIEPLGQRVLVEPIYQGNESPLLIIGEHIVPALGHIRAIGSDVIEMRIGDRVHLELDRQSVEKIKLDGREHWIMDQSKVIGVLEDGDY